MIHIPRIGQLAVIDEIEAENPSLRESPRPEYASIRTLAAL